MNRLYADEAIKQLGQGVMRLVHRLDKAWTRMVTMMDAPSLPWLLAGVPLLGAALGLLVWSQTGQVSGPGPSSCPG